MLGLTAYFDESGDANDPTRRFMGIAGLCAPEEKWTAFDEKWQAILDDQCGGKWFHMELFAAREGIFKGWDESRRRKLLGALTGAIAESEARPFGAVVSLEAYEYLAKAFPGVEAFWGEPYHLCFQDVTRAAAIQAMEHSWPFKEGVEQVAMVYAQQERYGTITSKPGASREQMGRAESLWYSIKDANPHFGQWMGAYASARPNNLSFLQAADLFAYELVHEFENQANPARASDSMRWALAHLLPSNSRNFLHKFYGLEQLIELLLDNNRLAVTEEQASAGSINSSLSRIDMRDMLFRRVCERRNRGN